MLLSGAIGRALTRKLVACTAAQEIFAIGCGCLNVAENVLQLEDRSMPFSSYATSGASSGSSSGLRRVISGDKHGATAADQEVAGADMSGGELQSLSLP